MRWTLGIGIMAVGALSTSLAFVVYMRLVEPRVAPAAELADATSAPVPGSAVTRTALVAHLERYPNDGRTWVLLARRDFVADRFSDAVDAYAKALAASPKVARDPEIWCEYADALGMAQGGSLDGKPRELIERALAIDSNHPKALEMAGSAAYEQRDYDNAARYWRALLTQMKDEPQRQRELSAALVQLEARNGRQAIADSRRAAGG